MDYRETEERIAVLEAEGRERLRIIAERAHGEKAAFADKSAAELATTLVAIAERLRAFGGPRDGQTWVPTDDGRIAVLQGIEDLRKLAAVLDGQYAEDDAP